METRIVIDSSKRPTRQRKVKKSDFNKALNKIVDRKKWVSHSDFDQEVTSPTKISNGFIDAIFSAYMGHQELVLRPDDVWLQIISIVAKYIELHDEKLRETFVEHTGKLEIEISEDCDLINWPHTINKFSRKIKTHIKDDWADWFDPNFSTTTKKDLFIGRSILMGAMKSYFNYKMNILCGIPAVIFQGTLEDWQLLRKKIKKIKKLGKIGDANTDNATNNLKTWYKCLAPVIDKFCEAVETQKADKKFWESVCYHDSDSAGCRTDEYISGWCLVFCPFVEDNFILEKSADWNYGKINIENIESGIVRVPLTINNNGDVYDAIIYTGSLFKNYEKENNRVSPSWQWVIARGKDADLEKNKGKEKDDESD